MSKHLLTWTINILLSLAAAEQPSAPKPVAAPMRALPWGDLNFLQTTDSHGWQAGHLQEPQYSADWGDYVSFAERMHEKADSEGVDLLLIDTGDRIEGNGLYDGSNPKGEYFYDIVKEQHIDVICTGNHELYQADAAAREYNLTVPNFKGKYLASNLDYINPATGEQIPMAQRYRMFTTKNRGIRIVAFGFLFNFNGNANNTVVQKVEDTIKEPWFQDAIREDVDLFLVVGHVMLHGPEYKAIYTAIRSQKWDTPIQFFGGHSHIRDYKKYDSNAYGLQGGRYMETIGWMAIEGLGTSKKDEAEDYKELKVRASMSFNRRYIDTNLFGYHYHTGLNETTFPTEHGKNVSYMIRSARKALSLDYAYGCAPRDLWLNRAPYPSNNNILTWLENEVIPEVATNEERRDVPRLAIINSGTMRFDIFKGAFTKDTTYIISPFVSKFLFIKDVPYSSAKGVLALLNNAGPILESESVSSNQLAPPEQLSILKDSTSFLHSLDQVSTSYQTPMVSSRTEKSPDLIPGYTTQDDSGSDGDDTVHEPISFYRVPNCIQSPIAFPAEGDPEKVDVVFVDFIQPWVLTALEYSGAKYTAADVEVYTEESLTELMAKWIKNNWEHDC
ncbi:Metallo-dependent phosphatase-like protein [Amylocarpus encephaloides]|uniref:Metallo-dependent phosphatase-like protein n=1 Tax=Amylocarpus encephaloides TaxID=45428 RepID=A0A9P7YF16_9HELO|nr:Metallo-dependent phosphatase-like protein [Amylocarpus encephaloides]